MKEDWSKVLVLFEPTLQVPAVDDDYARLRRLVGAGRRAQDARGVEEEQRGGRSVLPAPACAGRGTSRGCGRGRGRVQREPRRLDGQSAFLMARRFPRARYPRACAGRGQPCGGASRSGGGRSRSVVVGGGVAAKNILLKSKPSMFDASGLVVEQHFATSKDGTKIPYFVMKPEGIVADGTNPTLLDAYGGFEISMLPYYSAGVGAGWLEKGGVNGDCEHSGRRRVRSDLAPGCFEGEALQVLRRRRGSGDRSHRAPKKSRRRPSWRASAAPMVGCSWETSLRALSRPNFRGRSVPGATPGHESLLAPAGRRVLDG